MSDAFLRTVGIGVLTASVLLCQTGLHAQDRPGQAWQGAWLPLVDAGSLIGITVDDSDAGVVVRDVRAESPAARAGLKEGDVVTEFDGERTRSAAQLRRVVRETAPGRTVKITVLRNSTPTTLDIAPEARKADDIRFPGLARDLERLVLPREFEFDIGERGFGFSSPRRLGVAITPLSNQLAAYFGVPGGVLVSEVTAGSAGEMAGLKAGDVITMIQGQAVSSSDDVIRELRDVAPGTSVEIRVMRDRTEVTLTAKMPERTRAFFRRGERRI
jgi:serine protease Do